MEQTWKENGKKYIRITKGIVKKGYEYRGDTDKSITYKPDEWRPCPADDPTVLIEDMTTLIFRRPVEETENPVKSYPIEDLMKWRNKARERVDKMDGDLKYIDHVIREYAIQRNRILKKRQKDVRWISRLNHALYQKVIKERN